jgi:hypothetical protein
MTDTPTPISDEARTNGALSSPTTAYDLCVMLEREAIEAHESFLKASSHAFQFGKERDELRERVRELERALYRFEIEDVTLSEGDEMDLCVTFEDQQILRAALTKTKEAK